MTDSSPDVTELKSIQYGESKRTCQAEEQAREDRPAGRC